jgi:hypothetical protein
VIAVWSFARLRRSARSASSARTKPAPSLATSCKSRLVCITQTTTSDSTFTDNELLNVGDIFHSACCRALERCNCRRATLSRPPPFAARPPLRFACCCETVVAVLVVCGCQSLTVHRLLFAFALGAAESRNAVQLGRPQRVTGHTNQSVSLLADLNHPEPSSEPALCYCRPL